RSVPDAQDAVLAAGDHDPAVGRCRGRMHEVRGAGERPDLITILFDQPDFAVTGRGEGLVRVTDETDRSYFFVGAADVLLTVAGPEVPELDDVVGPGAGQGASVPFPAHAEDMMRVSFELLQDFAGGDFDDFGQPV